MIYKVEFLITNKEGIRDPEGETVKKFIVDKVTNKVEDVRAGKYIVVNVNVSNKEDAENIAKLLLEKTRLYNPVIHKVEVRVKETENCHN
ncbi:hypothetical protein CM19_07620 [Candidatus Acidianus copahuensis]|uniref:Phosphoribosylformylglycinamidine synthase subunit PurS n=1 Tax=Candidatus Acidianus copahuensis TaxID=1160895 RepID=A0A031LLB5_9CREN|nr:phosphoribosylformylglycinamidine synthase subunit PurS [Candidatus Acidianus copahuensis]EZQ04842.1 hypothetical protein CM19_07620 [Candidatus Acidianus copahuensis]